MKYTKKVSAIIVLIFTFTLLLFSCKLFNNNDIIKEARGITSYDMELSLDTSAHTLTESVVIGYHSPRSGLSELKLHLYPNAYGEWYQLIADDEVAVAYVNSKVSNGDIALSSIGSDTHEIKGYEISGTDKGTLTVTLNSSLDYNEYVELTICCTVNIANIKHRLGYVGNTYNLGNFYPQMCVYEDGEWCENIYYTIGDPFYSETADYNILLTLPLGYTVASSGEITSIRKGNGVKNLSMTLSCARDFAMCVSSEYLETELTVGDLTLKYYFVNDNSYKKTMDFIKNTVNTFSEAFTDYPYKQYSVVMTPFCYGGMEYPCLSYISDTLTVSDRNETIIHETAHQWWYSLVGNNQITASWLDEGLAEYSTTYYYLVTGNLTAYRNRVNDYYNDYTVFCEMAGHLYTSTNMARTLGEMNGYDYYATSYLKGMLMFYSLSEIVGTAKLNLALSEYARQYAYKTATPEDFISIIGDVLGKDFSYYFNPWIEGKVVLY